eukprot:3875348-Pleurochrysis_carterae.AAC.1
MKIKVRRSRQPKRAKERRSEKSGGQARKTRKEHGRKSDAVKGKTGSEVYGALQDGEGAQGTKRDRERERKIVKSKGGRGGVTWGVEQFRKGTGDRGKVRENERRGREGSDEA